MNAGRHTMSPGNRTQASTPLGGGTPGGLGFRRGVASRRPSLSGIIPQGDAAYLWGLVLLEVAAIAWLRSAFKRYHGG